MATIAIGVTDSGAVILTIGDGDDSMEQSVSPNDAREIAGALLTMADVAELDGRTVTVRWLGLA